MLQGTVLHEGKGYTSQHYHEDSSRGSEAEPDTRCTSINATETVDMPSVKLWKSCGVAGFVVELVVSCTTGINYKHVSSYRRHHRHSISACALSPTLSRPTPYFCSSFAY